MRPLEPGDPESIGAYRLLGRLGEGGMGRVYLARSPRGRTVAVKTIQPGLARDPGFRLRFAEEIAAARRVGGAWTASVLDADTEATTPWVATGYIAGPSLHQVVTEDYGPLPEPSSAALAAGLVRALRDIHDTGIVHRDLKPSNVLITLDGPRVIDFGIARAIDAATAAGLTRTGAVIGSPGFMSPEQIRGERLTTASDVFSLGCVLAFAATGKLPFGTEDSGGHALMFRIVAEEAKLDDIADGPLAGLIRDCLGKQPDQRPTIADLLARTADDAEPRGEWLPAEVLGQLGRHAVALLDNEDPAGRGGGPEAATAGRGSGPEAATAALPGSPSAATAMGHPAPAPTRHLPGSTPGQDASGRAAVPSPRPHGTPPHPHGTPPRPHRPPAARSYATGSSHAIAAGPWTPPPNGRTPAPARRADRSAAVLYGLLALFTLSLLPVIDTYAKLYKDLGAGISDAGLYGELTATRNRLDDHLLVFPDVLTFAILVVWLYWFWRVRHNAEAFAPGRHRHGPVMAMFCWFIPAANFYLPQQITTDIWLASQPAAGLSLGRFVQREQRSGLRLIHTWWLLLLLYALTGFAGVSQWWHQDSPVNIRFLVMLALLQKLAGAAAAISALVLVHRITSAQSARVAAAASHR